MKYGKTLKQRSIREWGHYNLDYDEVKYLIKEHTSPGHGKAISIPGQDNGGDSRFELRLFELLRDQHLRIELFVKSKTVETEKRLGHLTRQIRLFRLRVPTDNSADLSIRQLEKFARIETDIHKAGQDIRSLSRFVGVQRTGFVKLLKKYRKWTGSSDLGERFRAEILDQSIPLSRHNLDGLLEHWAEVLHNFRTVNETVQAKKDPWRRLSMRMSFAGGKAGTDSQASSAVLQHMHNAATSLSDVDFDTSFTTLPIGDAGTKAVYWIHPEQVVELTVILMQYMRQHAEGGRPGTAGEAGLPSRRSSRSRASMSRHGSIPQNMSQADLELDTGLLVLDDLDQYARKQSSSPIPEIQHTASGSKAPAGRVRWTSKSEAVLVLRSLQSDNTSPACGYSAARLKRKHLNEILSRQSDFSSRRSSATLDEEDSVAAQQRRPEVLQSAQTWLEKHEDVKPLASVCSRRTRFSGLFNDLSRGQWAVLDQNIYTTQISPKDIGENDWPPYARHAGTRFPYVVLQVRQEGPLAVDLIDLLDRSYLTERVRGFSLEAQAVWTCCKPASMASPSWLPLLNRDIRKLPNKEPVQRHHSIVHFSTSDDITLTSDAGTPGELSSSGSVTVRPSSSSMSFLPSSEAEQATRATKAKRKPKKTRIQIPDDVPREQRQQQQRYWNEYDDPESGDENNAYVLYIDPNAPLNYPGQAAIEKVIGWMTSPFKPRNDEERRMLLSPSDLDTSPTNTTVDGDDSSSDELGPGAKATTYGALPLPATMPAQQKAPWWSRYHPFRITSSKRSNRARRGSRPLDPFTAELEQQFHANEASKMRHCLTSLAAAVAILAISFVLAATGRRRQRGTVDEGVLFGIIVSLLFAFAGLAYLLSLNWKGFYGEDTGAVGKWLLRGVVATVFVGVCVADGALVAWMIA